MEMGVEPIISEGGAPICRGMVGVIVGKLHMAGAWTSCLDDNLQSSSSAVSVLGSPILFVRLAGGM